MECAIYAHQIVNLSSIMCLINSAQMMMHISKIFVVRNNTVQMYIEQQSYILLYWSMR